MDQKLISFCIPTYNRSSYLSRCIESLIGYRYDDIEIIIQDNCSSDNTREIIKNYNDERIKYFRNDSNIGLRLNIRTIIDKAEGEYCFFITDDDMLVPGAIPYIIDFILKSKPSAFICDTIVYLEKSNKSYVNSTVKVTKTNNELTINEKAKIILASHVLTGLCFRKEDIDFSFYDRNIDLWYPSIIMMGMSSNKMGYLANPVTIHTWENELFWGINNEDKELYESHIRGILKLEGKIDTQLFRVLIKQEILSYGRKNKLLTPKLTIYENLHINLKLFKKGSIDFIFKIMHFIKRNVQ